MFVFGKASLAEMQGVHPALVDINKRAIAICAVDFSVIDGLRTESEQRHYVSTGVSQTMASLHRIQPTGFGHAVDNVPWINGKPRWEWPPIYHIAAAMRMAVEDHNKARDAGDPIIRIRWGGCWQDLMAIGPRPQDMEAAVAAYGARKRAAGQKAFTDGPHYELM